ncbi:MAG: sugar ABC transporter permease [Gemmatimonadetes bacterium]|nr:MAG: sugar ABC transporter permease [Gemmatimonadota bacterium]
MGEWSMRKPDGSRGSRGSWGAWLTYALALPLAILMIAPFLYMVVSALMSEPDSLRHPVPDNFTRALVALPFGRFLLNSLIFSLAVVAGQVLTSATAAYAFARLRFPGRDRLFLAYLCALMAPAIVLVIPRFLLIDAFGWVDSYQGLISTELVSVSGIFLLRQFFRTIPRDLEDAARLEGAGEWTIFWRVIVPLARPALATLAVLAFADQWRSFMWPLVATRSSGMQPLEVGIANLEGVYHVSWSYQMAAAVAAVIPLMVLYFVAHRYFIRGIEQTARV